MRGRAKRMMGLGVIALNGAAVAQDSDSQPEFGALASHLSANVPCDAEDMVQALTAEIIFLGSSREDTLGALEVTRSDEAACDALKDASLELQTLAESEPAEFNQAFGFEQEQPAPEIVAIAEPIRDLEEPHSVEEKPLRPPRFSRLKTRSSY